MICFCRREKILLQYLPLMQLFHRSSSFQRLCCILKGPLKEAEAQWLYKFDLKSQLIRVDKRVKLLQILMKSFYQ